MIFSLAEVTQPAAPKNHAIEEGATYSCFAISMHRGVMHVGAQHSELMLHTIIVPQPLDPLGYSHRIKGNLPNVLDEFNSDSV